MSKPDPIGTLEVPVYSFRDDVDGTDFTIPSSVQDKIQYSTPAGKLRIAFDAGDGVIENGVVYVRLCNRHGGTAYIRADELALAAAKATLQDPNKGKSSIAFK